MIFNLAPLSVCPKMIEILILTMAQFETYFIMDFAILVGYAIFSAILHLPDAFIWS